MEINRESSENKGKRPTANARGLKDHARERTHHQCRLERGGTDYLISGICTGEWQK